MKLGALLEKNVYCEGLNVGKVINAHLKMEEKKLTHLEIELTKEATEQILGVTPSMFKPVRNTLAVSALAEGEECCTEDGIVLKVSKGQLPMYLRPA